MVDQSPLARLADAPWLKVSDLFLPTRQSHIHPVLYLIETDFHHFYSDTISSHEKKRHYLECLEQYVMYLHQQLELVGSQPVPLEQVSNYRGLSSRSIRVCIHKSFFFFSLNTFLDLVGSHGKYYKAPQSSYPGRRTTSKSLLASLTQV